MPCTVVRAAAAGGGGGRGGAYLFVACPINSHSTIGHAFLSRRSPFLLLIEIPPKFGRLSHFFHILHTKICQWHGGDVDVLLVRANGRGGGSVLICCWPLSFDH